MERFIEVPVAIDISDIDLSTRVNRVRLQTAFREMVTELSDEMQINTNNFREIDASKVYMVCNIFVCYVLFWSSTHDRHKLPFYSPNMKVHVHNTNEQEEKWTVRLKMTFESSSEYPGWTRSTILSSLRCCRRIKILVRKFVASTIICCTLVKPICRCSKSKKTAFRMPHWETSRSVHARFAFLQTTHMTATTSLMTVANRSPNSFVLFV